MVDLTAEESAALRNARATLMARANLASMRGRDDLAKDLLSQAAKLQRIINKEGQNAAKSLHYPLRNVVD